MTVCDDYCDQVTAVQYIAYVSDGSCNGSGPCHQRSGRSRLSNSAPQAHDACATAGLSHVRT
jgi:hypothetical protein